jgi:hypothetical protein
VHFSIALYIYIERDALVIDGPEPSRV